MQDVLIKKFHDYLVHNHPDVLVPLQQVAGVSKYLEERVQALEDLPEVLLAEGKPVYIVEEVCMDALTRELRPSKFIYLSSILEGEFEAEYYRWMESGILIYEVINLIEVCAPVFEAFGFNQDNEDDKSLRYAVIGTIREYISEK